MAEKEIDPIRERLKNYLFVKGLKMAQLERSAGLSTGYLRNGKGGLGTDKIARILEACPDLNGTWLMTGMGDMITPKSGTSEQNAPTSQRAGKITNVVKPTAKYMVNDGTLQLTEETDFFIQNNTLALIESVEIEDVPQKHRNLVGEIQKRKLDFEQAKAERDEKQIKIDELTSEVIADKKQIIELMSEIQRLKEKQK